jgi:hypothetical protein
MLSLAQQQAVERTTILKVVNLPNGHDDAKSASGLYQEIAQHISDLLSSAPITTRRNEVTQGMQGLKSN